ncbi:Twinfilin-2 [Zancudomyces culisetae]|uniref:Twinfilin-2 n=1 Tax=Zancudomyces culisetae TaxID=1213189 RepID=A0A1R1PFJ1_ZANCU|nr:Twinfilin-2 [Zancudomyces culisetae]|eukprot:OMH79727.1 Twinfilin-2 [Zancudomyces culisetae]
MITTQVDISERSELEYKEYLRYINEKKAPATLTAQEKAEQKMRMDQAVSEEMMRGTERKNIVPGLALELTEDAKEELHNLHIGKQALVILKVNREKGKGEVIDMDKGYDFASLSKLVSLESLFPNSEPRFGFFLCKKDQSELRTPNTAHLMEMDHLESIFDEPVFIYSCPPDCTIQDKMLYASSKAALLEKVHCEFGLVEKKRIEVSDPAELTIEFIKGELSRLKMTSTVNSNASSSYFAGSNSLGDQQMFISGTESQLQRPSLGKNLRKFNKPLAPSRKKSMS